MGASDLLQIGSLISGSIPMVQGLAQNYQLRHDPLLQDVGRIGVDQYNSLVSQNPYGNPMTGWGGMFGQNADGSNTGFGEAYVRGLGGMMNYNQGSSNNALSSYQQLSGQQSPQMVDAANPMRQMMGMGPSQAFNQQPGGQMPQGVQGYGMPNTGVSVPTQGAGAPQNQQLLDRNDVGAGIDWLAMYQQMNQNQNGGNMVPGGGINYQNPMQAITNPYGYQTASNGGGSSLSNSGFGWSGQKDLPRQSAPQAQAQAPQQMPQQSSAPMAQQATQNAPQAQNAYSATGNPYGQLMQSPVAYSDQMQNQMYNQAKVGIDQESRDALRRMRETAGAGGYLDSGQMRGATQALDQNRIQQLANARLGIQQKAADTNYAQLGQAAGLQSQTTQGLSQLDLAQNQQRQDAYNSNYANTARTIDQMYGIGNQGMNNAQNLWSQLQQTGLAGINLPNQALGQVEQRQMNRIVGPSVSSGPTYIGGTSQGGGGGGSSGMGQAIGQGLGYWAAGGFQSPWS